jgi:hypothetical protein
MNAIRMLKADHKRVKDLFREYESASDRAYERKRSIADKVFKELEVHSKLEEEIFYPAVRERADEDGKELVLEGIVEHHVVESLIIELRARDPEDEEFDAKFKVLTENVEHHIEEEEGEMLPNAEKVLSRDLDRLGSEMEERKKQLLSMGVGT